MRCFVRAVLLVAAICSAAQASIIFTLGNNPQPGETNILLNSGATGLTVTGTPSGFPAVTVNFTSTQTLLAPSSGQARVSASPEGTPLTGLSISLSGGLTYGDLIINPFTGGCSTCTGGASTITVDAVDSMGHPEAPVVFTGLTVGNGSNFLTIVAGGGESIVSTSLSVPGGINDLRQPRISGPFATTVPEPATFALMSLALAGLLLTRRLRSFDLH